MSDDVQLGAGSAAGEALDVELREVERRLEPERQLSEVLAHDEPLLEPVAGEAGRVQKPPLTHVYRKLDIHSRAELVRPFSSERAAAALGAG